MVSFSCEVCNDTLVKKRLPGHFQRCPQAYFTCIDCNKTFQGTEWQAHTSCISEEQKYQGKLYKPKTAQPPKAPSAPKKTPKTTETKDKATATAIKIDSKKSLYKVIKELKKTHKLDTKQLLKKITVVDGTLELK